MIKTEYIVKAPVDLTIAVASDLHENNPRDTIDMLRGIKPDVIAVPGDTLERYLHGFEIKRGNHSYLWWIRAVASDLAFGIFEKGRGRSKDKLDPEIIRKYAREVRTIAPVVMSLGNHEVHLTDEDRQIYKEEDIILLENDSVEIKGVLFGGLNSKDIDKKVDYEFAREFASEEGFKVLLSHHPEYFDRLSEYDIDLIISGHCHGGQVKVRGKGLMAPGQGFFPEYTDGLFEKKGSQMVVSAGVSNTTIIPRWGNPEEVAVVKLRKFREDCACRKTQCRSHGYCLECRSRHARSENPRPCERIEK